MGGERGKELFCLSLAPPSCSIEVATIGFSPMLGSVGKEESSLHLIITSFQEDSG